MMTKIQKTILALFGTPADPAALPPVLTFDAPAEGIEAREHATRTAALKRHKEELAGALEERRLQLDALRAAAEKEHATAVTAAERVEEETRAGLAARFVREFRGALGPLAREWIDGEPSRALAAQIAEALLTYDARALVELGAAPGSSSHTIAAELVLGVFADAVVVRFPHAVNAYARDDWGMPPSIALELVAQVFRAAPGGGTPLVDALEAIERALLDSARRAPMTADDDARVRFELRRSCATRFDLGRALDDFQRARQEARDAQFRATYVRPRTEVVGRRMVVGS